jgi:hypothetical protein
LSPLPGRQEAEQEQGFFYDVVVRLREDSLAFDKWIFFRDMVKGALTSAYIGTYCGINDHNLVVDRKWADSLFRGIVEDYYFSGKHRHDMWNNTEARIFQVGAISDSISLRSTITERHRGPRQVATDLNVTIRPTSMCEMPLIPLRAAWNASHWLVHPQYAHLYRTTCIQVMVRSECLDNGQVSLTLTAVPSAAVPLLP